MRLGPAVPPLPAGTPSRKTATAATSTRFTNRAYARSRRGVCLSGKIRTRMARYVYDFDEPSNGGRELLGGKGIGLAEMTQLGIPVPAGFTITTDACRAYMASPDGLPEGLEEEIEQHLRSLEERTGKRFGDADDPLLVSVRSGAAISMPGMMDTILNVGLNDTSVQGLSRATDNEWFAHDCYRRLIE